MEQIDGRETGGYPVMMFQRSSGKIVSGKASKVAKKSRRELSLLAEHYVRFSRQSAVPGGLTFLF